MNPNKSNSSKSTSNSSTFEPQYKKKRLLGEGSYGKAFLVEETHTKKEYAMKTIIIKGLSKNEVEDAKKEVKILKKLDHPNIIHFKEVFICKLPKLTLNIITEFADGGDLSQKIEKQKESKTYFKEDLILDYFTQICLALYHVHSHKVIHRDIKAQNIFLTKNGIIKLGDFGIAKNLGNTWDFAKTIIGTPYYLSPEIINNKPYNNKTDIWSLGVLLYQMITLKLPFEANNLPILSFKILKGKYNPIPSCFSKKLAILVNHLLKVNPDERPEMTEILKYDIIRERMKVLLDEVSYNKDFSNTFIGAIKEEKKEKKKSKFANFQNNNNNNNNNEIKNIIKKTKTNPVEIHSHFHNENNKNQKNSNIEKSHSNKIEDNAKISIDKNNSSSENKNKKEIISGFLKKSKEINSNIVDNSNNTTISNSNSNVNSINASVGDNNKSNNLKDFINEGSMQIIFQDKNNNEILYNLNGITNKSGKEKNYPKIIITNKKQNKKPNNIININQKISFNNLNNNKNNSNNNSLKSEENINNNNNNNNVNDDNYFKIEYNENIHNNNNINKKKEFKVKKDLYDAHRILQNYNSILNNEVIDNNNLDTIYNEDDYGEIENDNNENKIKNNSLEKENEKRFAMSIINNEDRQEINKIKKDLEKQFGSECDELIKIFEFYCDKEKFAIDIEGVKAELKKRKKSKEKINSIIDKIPEFTCLCVNKRIS